MKILKPLSYGVKLIPFGFLPEILGESILPWRACSLNLNDDVTEIKRRRQLCPSPTYMCVCVCFGQSPVSTISEKCLDDFEVSSYSVQSPNNFMLFLFTFFLLFRLTLSLERFVLYPTNNPIS